jgi:hypothetical protein
VYTVGSAKTVYIRALEIHSLDASNVANVQVHVVPASGGVQERHHQSPELRD